MLFCWVKSSIVALINIEVAHLQLAECQWSVNMSGARNQSFVGVLIFSEPKGEEKRRGNGDGKSLLICNLVKTQPAPFIQLRHNPLSSSLHPPADTSLS